MASDYAWKPIEDLAADWPALVDSELSAIRQVYSELTAIDPAAAARWQTESHREWAIETGRVEGVYRWDRGTTETLMARGIVADLIPRQGNELEPEQIAAIIHDSQAVLEGLFAFVKGDRPLSKSYIHELHQALLQNIHTYPVTNDQGVVSQQRLEKGTYKRWPNSVKVNGGTHQYCPPEHVDAEMDRLIEWHRRHVMDEVAPEVEAAWLHHRFTQIHPYPDGNGRVARALATLVLIKGGHFPLTVQDEEKRHYWDALLAADRGQLEPFIASIRAWQGRDLVALSQAVQLRTVERGNIASVRQAILAIRLDVIDQGEVRPEGWTQLPARLAELHRRCHLRLNDLVQELHTSLGGRFVFAIGNPAQSPVDRKANLQVGSETISFHFTLAGEKDRGLGQCSASLQASSLTAHPFLITHAEQEDAQYRRFERWMETALVSGLQQWGATLTP